MPNPWSARPSIHSLTRLLARADTTRVRSIARTWTYVLSVLNFAAFIDETSKTGAQLISLIGDYNFYMIKMFCYFAKLQVDIGSVYRIKCGNLIYDILRFHILISVFFSMINDT